MTTSEYSYSTYDFDKTMRLNAARRKVMAEVLRAQHEWMSREPSIAYVAPGTSALDDAVLALADELRPAPKVPEVIVKIDGELSEDAAMKIQRALNKLHKRNGGKGLA